MTYLNEGGEPFLLGKAVATERPWFSKADTAFQGASVGHPTERCLAKLMQDPAKGWMLPVLHLDPAIERPAQ
jgi:hypothetical protein